MHTHAEGPERPPGALTLRLDHLRAGVAVVHASGCLDRTTAPDLQHVLDDQLAAAPWAVMINLSAVSVLKPDAVPTLIHIAYRAGETDIGVCLITADHTVNETLATAGVAELFEIYPTTKSALRALG